MHPRAFVGKQDSEPCTAPVFVLGLTCGAFTPLNETKENREYATTGSVGVEGALHQPGGAQHLAGSDTVISGKNPDNTIGNAAYKE